MTLTDDNLNVAQMMIYATDRLENFVGKGENAGYQHFLLFLQCFQKPHSSRLCVTGYNTPAILLSLPCFKYILNRCTRHVRVTHLLILQAIFLDCVDCLHLFRTLDGLDSGLSLRYALYLYLLLSKGVQVQLVYLLWLL